MARGSHEIVSVIIPCCNEEGTVAACLARMRAVAEDLPEYDVEFLFVDDGSRDATNAILVDEAAQDFRVKVVTLSRNFGHQRAITAGLDLCSGDYIVIIDADLQNPPEHIPAILERLKEGYDLVHMVRANRQVDSVWKRVSARGFYALMRRYVLPELPENAPDFKGFNRRVLEALRQYPERVRFLRGLFATLGFRQTTLAYTREARHAGRSKYPLSRILAFGRDAVASFSVIPLRLSLAAGMVTCLAAVVFLAACGLRHWAGSGLRDPVLMILITLLIGLSGLILVTLGIVGEYLGCMMRELKQRPLYLVESVRNLTPPRAPEDRAP